MLLPPVTVFNWLSLIWLGQLVRWTGNVCKIAALCNIEKKYMLMQTEGMMAAIFETALTSMKVFTLVSTFPSLTHSFSVLCSTALSLGPHLLFPLCLFPTSGTFPQVPCADTNMALLAASVKDASFLLIKQNAYKKQNKKKDSWLFIEACFIKRHDEFFLMLPAGGAKRVKLSCGIWPKIW